MPGTQLTLFIDNATVLAQLEQHAHHARGAYASNTERAFRSDTALFSAWCAEHSTFAVPARPETVAAFLDDMATTRATATVRRYAASIAALHRAAKVEDPTKDEIVRTALRRIARAKGTRQRQAAPLNRPILERLLAAAGGGLRGIRDRALIAVAYDTLCRRSELAALNLEDVAFAEDGTGTVLVRKSKTDQAGAGMTRFLAADTCGHLRAWLEAARPAPIREMVDGRELDASPVFRGLHHARRLRTRLDAEEVARIYKRLARLAGVPADGISGHSTRVGAAQDLTAAGFGLAEVMQAGGWKSGEMVARYTERLQARRGAMAKLAVLQNRAG
jgi:integrase